MGLNVLGGLGGRRKTNQIAAFSAAILVLVVTAPAVIVILSDSRRIPWAIACLNSVHDKLSDCQTGARCRERLSQKPTQTPLRVLAP